VYLLTNFLVFDISASKRCHDQNIEKYIPIAVSVKARHVFDNSDMLNKIACMKDQITNKGIRSALCLLIVLDAKDAASLTPTHLLKKDVILQRPSLQKAFVIGPNDPLGISDLVEMTCFGGSLSSEI
jgi:hypothetical protein